MNEIKLVRGNSSFNTGILLFKMVITSKENTKREI